MITAEMFERTTKEVNDYARANFGSKNGVDFAEFARTIASTETFKGNVQAMTLMGMMGVLFMPRKKEGEAPNPEKDKAEMDKILNEDSPLKTQVADLLYVGYRLGLADAEKRTLESMAGITQTA